MSNGIDIVKIERFVNVSTNFIDKNFNINEIKYINSNVQTMAGLFCAKEALLKALKKGINDYSLKDIEVTHNCGAPEFIFHNDLEFLSNYNISLSIAHDGDYCVAMVSIVS